ncbi:MAG: hypothetical protein ACTSRU_13545 [Candidatus Hodarchaeales archaeon]
MEGKTTMNFEIANKERLHWNTTLKIIGDVIRSKQDNLAAVIIRADDETQELELFARNGSMDAPVEFLAIFDSFVADSGECMMNAAHFCKLAEIGKNESLDFRINDSSCFIKGKNRFVEIPNIEVVALERAKIPTMININKEDFHTAIRNVGSNLKKNSDQVSTTLKIGSGQSGTVLEFFSADHHRMTMFTMVQLHQLTNEIAIHQNSLKAILLFLNLEGNIQWGFDTKSMYLKSEHMLLVVPLIEAYRSDVGQLFKQQDETDIQLTVDIKEVIEASRKCKAIFSLKKSIDASVIGELTALGQFSLKSSADGLTAMATMECTTIKGRIGKFKVQPSYLENSLKNIEDTTALICFNDGSDIDPTTQLSGVIITGNINDTTKHLVMQMRINSTDK